MQLRTLAFASALAISTTAQAQEVGNRQHRVRWRRGCKPFDQHGGQWLGQFREQWHRYHQRSAFSRFRRPTATLDRGQRRQSPFAAGYAAGNPWRGKWLVRDQKHQDLEKRNHGDGGRQRDQPPETCSRPSDRDREPGWQSWSIQRPLPQVRPGYG